MKVNLVTGKPADGGPARCLIIDESADPVLDFFTKLRAAEGVLKAEDGTEERFVKIALFQRPATTKRSSFEHPSTAAAAPGVTTAKPKAKKTKPGTTEEATASGEKAAPATPPAKEAGGAQGSEEEETGI